MIELRSKKPLGSGIDPHLDRELYLTSSRKAPRVGLLTEASPSSIPASVVVEFSDFSNGALPSESLRKFVEAVSSLLIDEKKLETKRLENDKGLSRRLEGFDDTRQKLDDRTGDEQLIKELDESTSFTVTLQANFTEDPNKVEAEVAAFRTIVVAAIKVKGVSHIQLSPRLKPQLEFAKRDIQAQPEESPTIALPEDLTGRGVIVGIVDFGCDFVSQNFRNADGGTRILALWDQNEGGHFDGVPTGDRGGVDYGRVFTQERINEALRDPQDPYRNLGYHPHDNYYQNENLNDPSAEYDVAYAAHGTAVLDVAAGNGRAYREEDQAVWSGIAPETDIVFVQVRVQRDRRREAGVRPQAGETNRTVLYADNVIDGVRFIFDMAKTLGQPAVVNLSLNTNGGPHDGDSYFDRRLNAMLRERENQKARAVTVAVGNARQRGIHASAEVRRDRACVLTWEFKEGDRSRNDLEIWYQANGARLVASLIDLNDHGRRPGPVAPEKVSLVDRDDKTIGIIVGSRTLPALGDAALSRQELLQGRRVGRQAILVSIIPSGKAERWGIELALENAYADEPVKFDAWIDRDNYDLEGPAQSRFIGEHISDDRTLGALSTGQLAFVVGGYSAVNVGRAPYFRSGAGPTRTGAEKPDLAAPAVSVRAYRSLRLQGQGLYARYATGVFTGTSIAAPFVAGTIALLFQLRPDATRQDVEDALLAGVDPPEQPEDISILGRGKLRVAATLEHFRNLRRIT